MGKWGKYLKKARSSVLILALLALPLGGQALAQDAIFAAVGDEALVPGGKILTSADGAAWVPRTSAGTQLINLWAVTRGGGLFVRRGGLGDHIDLHGRDHLGGTKFERAPTAPFSPSLIRKAFCGRRIQQYRRHRHDPDLSGRDHLDQSDLRDLKPPYLASRGRKVFLWPSGNWGPS